MISPDNSRCLIYNAIHGLESHADFPIAHGRALPNCQREPASRFIPRGLRGLMARHSPRATAPADELERGDSSRRQPQKDFGGRRRLCYAMRCAGSDRRELGRRRQYHCGARQYRTLADTFIRRHTRPATEDVADGGVVCDCDKPSAKRHLQGIEPDSTQPAVSSAKADGERF